MLAIIAGTGNLPLEACKKLLADSKKFFVICLFEENEKILRAAIGSTIEIICKPLYKPAEILTLLQSRQTTQVLLIGKVNKQLLFKKIRFDWLALSFLASTLVRSDQALMEQIVKLFERYNIQVISQDSILGFLHMPPGIITGTLDATTKENIKYGMHAAQQIATLDIGQTVIVKDMTIIAVEGLEGTDACIKRGLELGIADIIICKAAHKNQNKKFDLPTLGLATINQYQRGQIKALAWQASNTLIADQASFIQQANKLDIILVSYADEALL
jgi:DUF1009 family protein